MSEDITIGLLRRLSELAAQANESLTARRLNGFAVALAEAGKDPRARQDVLRRLAGLFVEGVGGLQDVVLQDAQGVRPEHDYFDRLRDQLFIAVRNELGAV